MISLGRVAAVSCVFLLMWAMPIFGGSPLFIRGDYDGDQQVNIADAINVLDVLFSATPVIPLTCDDAADANDDGLIDVADAVTILAHLFNSGGDLPSPFPGCGEDPTPDSLGCATPPAGCIPPAPPPEITSLPSTIANSDTPYEYPVQVVSEEPVTFTLDLAPADATIDPVIGVIEWLPVAMDVGPHDFMVRATSSAGFDEQSFTVTVNEWPGAPVLQLPPSPTPLVQVVLLGNAPGVATVEFVNEDQVVSASTGAGGSFAQTVDLFPNQTNLIHVRGINGLGQVSAPTTAIVIQDSQLPEVFIDNPVNGSTTFDESIDVLGRVSDMLSGFMGLIVTVSVNGRPLQPADVNEGIGTNGTFFASPIALNLGLNTIEVTALDGVGNSATAQAQVERLELDPAEPTLIRVSGNDQSAAVNSDVDLPLVVQVTDMAGAPFANKLVNFTVIRSDGRVRDLLASAEDGLMLFQAFTDASGMASATWQLGSDAGAGNQRVEVTSAGIQNSLLFCASATAAAPVQINVGAGNNQRGEVGMPAECVLCAWVSDGCNGVAGVPVTFTVTRNNGLVAGQSEVTVVSDQSGHAEVPFAYGTEPGNNFVSATTASNTGSPAVFNLFGVARDPLAPTSFSGLVLSNSSQPIVGATCTLDVPGEAPLVTMTTADGRFEFPMISGDGVSTLTIDAATATAVGSRAIPTGSFPYLYFEPIIVPNAANSLPMPVLIPQLNPNNWESYSTTQPTELTVEGIEGLRMVVEPGSMTLRDGTAAPDGTPISLNIVHHDDVPMPMPDGAAPPFAWTLQPAEATFDPPIVVEYPNMSGLPPGAIANFLTFSHDTGKFEIFASGSVSESGEVIVTDEGDGLALSGWGCNCPPYSVTGDCCQLPPPNGCGSPSSAVSSSFFSDCPMLGLVCFTNGVDGPCDRHDQCYSICGKSKEDCDSEFFFGMADVCLAAPPIPGLALTCLNVATAYYFAVVLGGGDAYDSAQADCCPVSDTTSQIVAGGLPMLADADGDFIPDDWELSFGLNPNDPADAELDFDFDTVINRLEFFNFLDPLSPDTDGNGITDDVELAAVAEVLFQGLDETWTVNLGGQGVTPNADGAYLLTNVSAPDQFGLTGPGSAPDFLGDDLVRVVASSAAASGTLYAFSEPFRLSGGQVYGLESLTFTNVPPPLPESLRFEPPSALVLEVGESLPLSVIATLGDGADQDVTPTTSWTTYRVSNPVIATVDAAGMVTGHTPATAFVTATNEGAIAVKRVAVTQTVVDLTIVGFVVLPGGMRAGGAEVTSIWGPPVLTNPDGSFSMSISVPVTESTVTLSVSANASGTSYAGSTGPLPVASGRLIDAGIVTLATGAAYPGLTFAGTNSQGYDEYTLDIDPTVVMILIPGGTFEMGVTTLVHQVTLSPYFIAKYEITTVQYRLYCDATLAPYPPPPSCCGMPADHFTNPLYDDHPVVMVSWNDLNAPGGYLDWAGLMLPTEAQWEFAARGTPGGNAGRTYPWGDDLPDAGGVYRCNGCWGYQGTCPGTDDGWVYTSPVAQSPFDQWPSPFGTLGQAGNVWEWCQDWFGNYPSTPQTDPTGPAAGSNRVFRGGSWFNRAGLVSWFRNYIDPSDRYGNVGFRAARVIP